VRLITELRDNQCRWPVSETEAGSHFFCARLTSNPKRSYCDKHHALAYIPGEPWSEEKLQAAADHLAGGRLVRAGAE
jgi:hypothetical protein